MLLSTTPASAASLGSTFACAAAGDNWSVTASAGPDMTCAVRCLLHDAGGEQDSVSCSPFN